MIGLLANGLLLEGVPGLAKTLAVRTLAAAIHTRFRRIQFTPDLLPADLIGTQIYNPKTGDFGTRQPVFANVILADEINRAPAKVQSALLEAMVSGRSRSGRKPSLPDPFLVLYPKSHRQEGLSCPKHRWTASCSNWSSSTLGTRNAASSRPTPAQVDFRRPWSNPKPSCAPAGSSKSTWTTRSDYILSIVFATRDPPPSSRRCRTHPLLTPRRGPPSDDPGRPRHAFLQGRGYVTPDVKSIALDVLRHRVIPSFEAEAEDMTAEKIVATLLNELPAP